ncbi:MAG: hypothetical protein KHY89_07425 [Butyricicoccus pullicaecorum]|nr:hypothetical protein [Butyricicoccus pullicaecorum]
MEFPNEVVKIIEESCTPKQIILYGEKRTLATDKLKAASLCIVVPDGTDKHNLQHKLYLSIPADVPINLTLYTVEEWQELLTDATSYAAWIARKGRILYEQRA